MLLLSLIFCEKLNSEGRRLITGYMNQRAAISKIAYTMTQITNTMMNLMILMYEFYYITLTLHTYCFINDFLLYKFV